jgi:uncharacterized protein
MTEDDFSDELSALITNSELNELQDFLDSDIQPESAMILDTLDGFLTALVIGPASVPIKTWMPLVWDMLNGYETPAFESIDQAKRMTKLVLKMKESISMLFSSSPDLYCPLCMEIELESDEMYNSLVKLWATGFMVGIYCNENNWKPLFDKKEVFQELLMPIYLLSPFSNDALPLPTKTSNTIRGLIPEYVKEIRKFWLPQRKREMAKEKGVVIADETEQIGRNEPCPCGSGKKYKKCCGK